MSESMQSTTTTSMGVESNGRFLQIAGVIIAILGLLAIVFPFVTGIGISIALGALLVVGGLVHVASAFRTTGWKGFVWQLILGIVYAFAGISLLANPVVGLVSLTILLVAYFLVAGIFEIVMGIWLRDQRNWVGPVLSGVVSVILAGLLWIGFPSTAIWAVGLLFGVHLLTTGISMVFFGRGTRQSEAPMDSGTGPGQDLT